MRCSLLQQGAELEAQQKDKWTALHFSAHYEHLAVVQYLVENGAHISTKNSDGETALDLAHKEGHTKIAKERPPTLTH